MWLGWVSYGTQIYTGDDIEHAIREYNREKEIYDLWLNMKRRIKNQERAKNNELSKLKKQIKHLQKQNQELLLTIKSFSKK